MGTNVKDINQPLPQAIIKGVDVPIFQAKKHVENLLRQTVPAGDIRNKEEWSKWQLFLGEQSVRKTNRQKKKKTFLTRKQRKEAGLLKLPKEGWTYASLEPVRKMWQEYMRENLELIKRAPSHVDAEWNNFSTIVAKSEMVGADLKVIKSKVPSLIGISGTVILETRMTFQIVTLRNKLKTILKDTSVFEFILDNMTFTFLGKHLVSRPADRSVRKIRSLLHPDL
ncbi:ribonuclease P protein subunit p29 [Anthonomus grandis grandis]|uniref:ribonuclease P protein subunit p29 n=1 Tax=Anthonomus grandis grandis TaxID=2921223 RepID=UPI002166B4E1|nr:ribonuclease P protein subunit p29 [Anthonomus grandis grandis]